MFFVAIRNPVIGSTLRLEYRRFLASGATDFQYDSLTRVPGHEMVDKIDAIGEGVLGWKIGQRVGVGFLSITPCETLRPAPANLKEDLVLRPIFHQLEHRIEAHISIAFTSIGTNALSLGNGDIKGFDPILLF